MNLQESIPGSLLQPWGQTPAINWETRSHLQRSGALKTEGSLGYTSITLRLSDIKTDSSYGCLKGWREKQAFVFEASYHCSEEPLNQRNLKSKATAFWWHCSCPYLAMIWTSLTSARQSHYRVVPKSLAHWASAYLNVRRPGFDRNPSEIFLRSPRMLTCFRESGLALVSCQTLQLLLEARCCHHRMKRKRKFLTHHPQPGLHNLAPSSWRVT